MTDDSLAPDYDVVLVHGPTDDGNGARVVRARPGQLQVGEVRPVREGQAVNGAEVVTLHPREGMLNVCDVEVVHAKPPTPLAVKADRHGPAQVATNAYRTQYDRVFGNPTAPRRDSN